MKRLIIAALVGMVVCIGIASAQCQVAVNPTSGVMTDIGPVHNMEFQSSNNPIFFTTPDKDPTLYFPGAHWIQFGTDVDAGYINLGPNFIDNGACPKTWGYQPLSWMRLDKGTTLIWGAGPSNNVLTTYCTDADSDDSTCYFSVFTAATARSPQIAVTPGEILYAYDCFHAYVIGQNPAFATTTPARCGVIKLVIE